MKKSLKITLSIGLILSFLGLILIALSLSAGSLKEIQNLGGKSQRKEVKLDHIQSLDMDLSVKNIKIVPSQDQHFKLTYYKNSGEQITYNVQHQNLTLKQKERFKIQFFMLTDFLQWFHQDDKDTVTLAVPINSQLKKVSIENNIGNVTIDSQKTAKISLQQNTGNLNIYNSQIAKGKVSTDIGNINIKNSSLSDVDVDSDTGNISAKNLTILNLVRMNNNTGNTTISLSSQSARTATVSADTDLGDTDISHQLLQGYSGKNRLTIKGSTGSVQIK